jgi:ATP-dependent RNA helicase DDX46/PRP5
MPGRKREERARACASELAGERERCRESKREREQERERARERERERESKRDRERERERERKRESRGGERLRGKTTREPRPWKAMSSYAACVRPHGEV